MGIDWEEKPSGGGECPPDGEEKPSGGGECPPDGKSEEEEPDQDGLEDWEREPFS